MTARADAVTAVTQLAEQAVADRELLATVAESITSRVQVGGRALLTVELPEAAMQRLDEVTRS